MFFVLVLEKSQVGRHVQGATSHDAQQITSQLLNSQSGHRWANGTHERCLVLGSELGKFGYKVKIGS